ncbi:MAG: autotransporter-associated beta strand repeat-containing protein, partial [Planctomycetota bacterium]|nr:autotransporter-associated beta strand repeat-containing protein [Planctomycetota bacterium]
MFSRSTMLFGCLLAVAVLAWTGTAQAVEYTWSDIGTGTWDVTDTNWGGGGSSIWDGTNGPNNIAIFNTAGAAVSVSSGSGAVNANGITFSDTATISGDAITIAGTTPTITANADATISSAILGTNGLTKLGDGTLTLTGANSYTGATRINGGTLSTSGVPAGQLYFNGGIWEFTGATGSKDLVDGGSDTNYIKVTTGNLTVTHQYAGITKLGEGTLTIANTWWGDGGNLQVDEGTAVLAGVTHWYWGFDNIGGIDDVKAGATVKLGTGVGQQFNCITGNGVHFHMSGGKYDLNGNTMETPAVDGTGLITNSAVGTTAEVQIFLDANKAFGGKIEDGAGKVAVTIGAPDNYYGGHPTGLTWTLSGNNTYSGATILAASYNDILKADSTTAFSPNSAYTVNAGTTLDLAGNNNQIAGLTGDGTVKSGVGSGVLTVNNDAATSNADYTFGGVLRDGTVEEGGGQLGLTKAGSKTLTLSAANTYAGATAVNGGTLQIAPTGTINNTSGITVNDGGKFLYNNSTTPLSQPLTLTSGATLGGTGTIGVETTIVGGATVSPGASVGTLTISNNMKWENDGAYLWEIS